MREEDGENEKMGQEEKKKKKKVKKRQDKEEKHGKIRYRDVSRSTGC